jgi:hypothetical protein
MFQAHFGAESSANKRERKQYPSHVGQDNILYVGQVVDVGQVVNLRRIVNPPVSTVR